MNKHFYTISFYDLADEIISVKRSIVRADLYS